MTDQLADATRKRGETCAECGQPTTQYRLLLSPITTDAVQLHTGDVVCEACWREVVHLLEAE